MFTKLVRIGADAELRHTPNGKSVISLNCVYDVGFGQNKKSQWLEAAIWGKQAEALCQYLKKGSQIVIDADDLQIEEYEHNNQTRSKLKCRVINVSLVSGQASEKPQQAPQAQAPQQSMDNNFDDDIPF